MKLPWPLKGPKELPIEALKSQILILVYTVHIYCTTRLKDTSFKETKKHGHLGVHLGP